MALPVTFLRHDTRNSITGQIKNISSYGALAEAATPLVRNTFLRLFFRVPETGERVESLGTVRWCEGTEGCRLGIEFKDKVSFSLPFYEVAKLYSESSGKALTDYLDKRWDLKKKSMTEFQRFAYWGALFWTFSGPIRTLLSHLAGQIELCSFRFEHSYREGETSSPDGEGHRKVREAVSALEPISGKLNDMATVFSLLNRKQGADLTESGRHINLNHVIKDAIAFLEDIIVRLTGKRYTLNYLPVADLPSVRGQHSDFTQCIDTLLLYSYQHILFCNSTEITVQSMVRDDAIQIDFSNDGTRIIEKNQIVIDPRSDNLMDQLTPRDVRNILGLYYSLVSLEEYSASIVVHSESGNNTISLRIPIGRSRS